MTITEFLEARITEDESEASALLADLSGQISEEFAGAVDEKGPMTPTRLLSAQMWAHYAGQGRRRSFAKGQQIARLADPARVLAECAAKRAIIKSYASSAAARPNAAFGQRFVLAGMETGLEIAMKSLAAVYASHPDYKAEWAA